MSNDLKVADILAGKKICFNPITYDTERILSYIRGLTYQLHMLYDNGFIDFVFWKRCCDKSLLIQKWFTACYPYPSSEDLCVSIYNFIAWLNDNLQLAVQCEVSLGASARLYRLTYDVTSVYEKSVDVFANSEVEAIGKSYFEIMSPDVVDCYLLDVDFIEDVIRKNCNSCECDHICSDIETAIKWLIDHEPEIAGMLFEDVEITYMRGHPGQFTPFMLAWCARNGGI